jgi:APA family basic amino acid/polyamine antiporter
MVLRRTHPDLPRSFRVPALPVIGVLAIVACAWLMLNLTILTWLRFFVWMVIGVVVYFAYGRRHALLGKR